MNDVNLRYLDFLLKHFEPHKHHLVTLSELESVICTSRRNVSIVMKKAGGLRLGGLATGDWAKQPKPLEYNHYFAASDDRVFGGRAC